MRQPTSAGNLVALLFAALAILPATAADLGTESIEALRKRLDVGGGDVIAAEARRRLEAAGADAPLTTLLDLLNLLILADDVSGQGGGDEARASAEREVALTVGKEDTEPLLYARALADHGKVMMQAGDYQRAHEDIQRALDLRKTHGSADDPAIGRLLMSLGTIDLGLGKLDDAQASMEQGLAAIEKMEGPESIRAGRALTNLGLLMTQKREPAKSVELLLRARTIFAKDPGVTSATYSKVLDNLAIAYELTGDYVLARSTYLEAIERLNALYPQGHPDIAAVMHDFGVLVDKMGDTRAAEDLTRRAVAMYQGLVGPEHPDTLRMMNTYAHYLHELGRDAEAEALLRKTLSVRERTLGPDHYDTAETLADLGMLLVDQGDATAALPLLERALAICEKALGPDQPVIAINLENLAHCEAALGRRDEARAHFERALAIREARFGPDHPDVAAALSAQAAFLFSGATPLEALPPARRAASILARHARETIAGLPESQALLIVNGEPHPEVTLFSGLLSDAGGAGVAAGEGGGGWIRACWEWVLARRGVVLDELAERNRRGLLGGTAEAQEAWRRLATARTQLARLWANVGDDDPEAYRQALDEARGALDASEIDLVRTSAVYKEGREDARVGLDDVRRALPAGSALIECVRVPVGGATTSPARHDIALVLGPGDAMRFADLGASADIDAAVAAWRSALADSARIIEGPASSGGTAATDPLGQVTKRGEALRRRIWDPIATGLGGAKRVFLVPDGTLHAVDFAALPDRGRYLVETGPSIQILSTGRDIVRYARSDAGVAAVANRRGILAMGAPDFDATSEAQLVAMARIHGGVAPGAEGGAAFRGAAPACLDPAHAHWQPIPASGREAERVAGLYRGHEPALALTGAAASEARFKQEAPGRRVLHLATHGFFLGETCSGNDVVKGKPAGEPAVSKEGTAPAGNPLLQSGLVLAGANRHARAPATADDGILTAEELAALDLRAADLVVLSGCDTGRGEVSVGEGVFGLRRALEIAGARTVVMSLFPVPDRQTSRFMDRFYRARVEGRPIPDAARAASLQALEDLRRAERPAHPYYWSGFVTAGDWH